MLNEKDARKLVRSDALATEPFRMRELKVPSVSISAYTPDFMLELEWKGTSRQFAVEYKSQATPRNVRYAIDQVVRYTAERPNLLPMLLVPYLSDSAIEQLQTEEISGIDFSGNMAIIVPGLWLVLRTGQSNQYADNRPVKKPFSGVSSLVGQVFLSVPSFVQVQEVHDAILKRGGKISLSQVSKTLRELEEELIITRKQKIKLIQPEKLLDNLVNNYTKPVSHTIIRGKADLTSDFLRNLLENTDNTGNCIAGRSESRYVITPTTTEILTIYITSAEEQLRSIKIDTSSRFPNVEFKQIDDQNVFFATYEKDGFRWCSRLQIYLELMKGDKREKDAASQLRSELLMSSSEDK